MDKVIADGKLGTVGKWDVKFEGGFLVVEASAEYAFGTSVVAQKIGAKAVLEALKKAIPGSIDDAVITVIESALGV